MTYPQNPPTSGSITFSEPVAKDPREVINKGVASQTLATAQQKALEAIMGKTS